MRERLQFYRKTSILGTGRWMVLIWEHGLLVNTTRLGLRIWAQYGTGKHACMQSGWRCYSFAQIYGISPPNHPFIVVLCAEGGVRRQNSQRQKMKTSIAFKFSCGFRLNTNMSLNKSGRIAYLSATHYSENTVPLLQRPNVSKWFHGVKDEVRWPSWPSW